MVAQLPQITSFGTRVFTHDFNKDPLIRGTYTYRTTGAPARPKDGREGRLVLAGGDFSTRPGWMEGALESADTAVKEILST
jgi:monoamine oxidase